MASAQNRKGFALYLMPEVKPEQLARIDLKKIKPKGKPFLTSSGIYSYFKDTYEIILRPTEGEKIKRMKVPAGGKSFVVFVDDEAIYTGAFVTSLSSGSFKGVLIDISELNGDYPVLKTELFYPSLEQKTVMFDSRNDERLLQAFKNESKLFEQVWLRGKCKSVRATGKRRQSFVFTFKVISVAKSTYDSSEVEFELYMNDDIALRDAIEAEHTSGSFSDPTKWRINTEKEFLLKFERIVSDKKNGELIYRDFEVMQNSENLSLSTPDGYFYPIWDENEKAGFINASGKIVIKPQFDEVNLFYEDLAGVRVGEKWGFIDRTGKIVIEPQWKEVNTFSEGMAGVITAFHKSSFSPLEGDPVDLTLVECGYIDKTGNYLIKPTIERKTGNCPDFNDGRAVFYFPIELPFFFPDFPHAGKIVYMDKAGKFTGEPKFIKDGNFFENPEFFAISQGSRERVRRTVQFDEKNRQTVGEIKLQLIKSFSISNTRMNDVYGYKNKNGKYVWVSHRGSRMGKEWWDENYIGEQPKPNFR